jgi:hypothetical protein
MTGPRLATEKRESSARRCKQNNKENVGRLS